MKATDVRSLPRAARHERRVHGIRLRKASRPCDRIAEQTGLSKTGVFNICKRHADDGALNADIFIDFLKRPIKNPRKKTLLIVDDLRVHHGKPVKAWLAEHLDAIEVFYLFSYSLELNPDEMANADIKQAITTLAPTRTKLQRVKATVSHLRRAPKQPERVRNYFHPDPALYAA